MKKQLLAITVLSISMGLAACSSGKTADPTEAVTTTDISTADEATTEAGAEVSATVETIETETEEETMEAFDLDYAEGVITKINGSIITVKDEFEDREITFDISDANIIRTYPLTEGDYVEVAYLENTESNVSKAELLEVIDAVLAETEEPMMTGTVLDVSEDTLTVETKDGETYEFEIENAYIVAAKGIEEGKEVQVNFLGDPEFDETLTATRIVTEDSYNDPKAKLSAFTGVIDSVEEHSLVLVSAAEEYFTFVSPNINFSEFAPGETVQVTYTGSLAGKEISATAIERK